MTLKKNKKITIDTLARMTQDEFLRIGERFDKVDGTLLELKEGQKRILDVIMEIPSKKAFDRLENKVNVMDVALASVQQKINK